MDSHSKLLSLVWITKKKTEGLNQWIINVKVTPRLLKIYRSLFEKSSLISAGGVKTHWLTSTWSVDTDSRLVLRAKP